MQTDNAVLVDRESWVIHKGKHILRHDYSGLHGAQLIKTLTQHKDAVASRAQPEILALLILTNTVIDKEVISAFKTAGLTIKPYYKKVAMIGFGGVQKFFIQIVAKFTQITPGLFDTEEEAMDWLVK